MTHFFKSKLSAARTETRIQAQLFGVLMINPDFHEFTLNVAAIEQVTENHLHGKKSFMMFVKQIKCTIVYCLYCLCLCMSCLCKFEVITCFSIKFTTIECNRHDLPHCTAFGLKGYERFMWFMGCSLCKCQVENCKTRRK